MGRSFCTEKVNYLIYGPRDWIYILNYVMADAHRYSAPESWFPKPKPGSSWSAPWLTCFLPPDY